MENHIDAKIVFPIYDDPIYCNGLKKRCEQMSNGYCGLFYPKIDPLDFDHDKHKYIKKDLCKKVYEQI